MSASEMDERQRRAMFARLHGGGGGGGGRSRSSSPPTFGMETDANGKYVLHTADGKTLKFDTQLELDQYREMKADAKGIESAMSDALVAGLPGAGGLLSKLGPLGRALASWATPIASGAASLAMSKIREAHPTMDPRAEKALAIAQQIAAYVAAISGLAAGKSAAGEALEKIPVGSGTAASAATGALEKTGEKLSAAGRTVSGYVPEPVRKAASKAHAAYTKAADYTGASIADIKAVTSAPSKIKSAASLDRVARETLDQAAEIERIAATKGEAGLKQATDDLFASHKASLSGDPLAREVYEEAATDYWATKHGAATSAETAEQLRQHAQALADKAAAIRSEAAASTVKAAIVATGFAAKEIHEEAKIQGIQQDMEEAWSQGEDYVFDPADPRSALGTAAAFAAGTLGNPIEKQFRYGQDAYATQVANYRARYDAIDKAEASGEFSPGEAEDERRKLAEDKPRNMAGKGPWTFAPASAAFIAWQAGKVGDYFDHEVEVGTVEKVLDGDTIQLAGGKIVRMLGVDTPESVHPTKAPEFLGPEASKFQKENLTGKTVKLVKSPGAELDKYGRELAYVETLPGPLDAALAIPGVGKWIPASDQNLELIEKGYGQPRYLELSGGHDRQIEYDKATERARRAGVGVHSPEGLEKLEYHYETWDQKHGRGDAPPESALQTALGLGLMATGQSGAFKHMGGAGNIAAQTWNAILAGLGAADYNQKARERGAPVHYRPPAGTKTTYERQAEATLDRRRRAPAP
jgi:endonuclease YncB( thermonuclease family)